MFSSFAVSPVSSYFPVQTLGGVVGVGVAQRKRSGSRVSAQIEIAWFVSARSGRVQRPKRRSRCWNVRTARRKSSSRKAGQ
jgi:hypothetical protein